MRCPSTYLVGLGNVNNTSDFRDEGRRNEGGLVDNIFPITSEDSVLSALSGPKDTARHNAAPGAAWQGDISGDL